MQENVSPLTIQLLEWVATRPRTYGQAMDAWRTSCPRHPVWEDALIDGLIEVVDRGEGMNACVVALTELGRKLLDAAPTSRPVSVGRANAGE
jgi:hypothetical protein